MREALASSVPSHDGTFWKLHVSVYQSKSIHQQLESCTRILLLIIIMLCGRVWHQLGQTIMSPSFGAPLSYISMLARYQTSYVLSWSKLNWTWYTQIWTFNYIGIWSYNLQYSHVWSLSCKSLEHRVAAHSWESIKIFPVGKEMGSTFLFVHDDVSNTRNHWWSLRPRLMEVSYVKWYGRVYA